MFQQGVVTCQHIRERKDKEKMARCCCWWFFFTVLYEALVAADTCKKVPGKRCCGSGSRPDPDLIGVNQSGSMKAYKKIQKVKKIYVLKSLSPELERHSRGLRRNFIIFEIKQIFLPVIQILGSDRIRIKNTLCVLDFGKLINSNITCAYSG
jgi:hypothetical protein